MKHFPIFLAVENRRIVLSGGGNAALAKLRLLMKTEAQIEVYTTSPAPEITLWAEQKRLTLVYRDLQAGDSKDAALVYAADENTNKDLTTADLARADGALVNVVDNLAASAFITPAIVDRDPVTVAIGTEGAAPVLARAIKADLEERLSPRLGLLARIGKSFRGAASILPQGHRRRTFWSDYYFNAGPRLIDDENARSALEGLLAQHVSAHDHAGHVAFVGAGPGDPELLTLKARKALDTADVVIHDRLVSADVLELVRREATLLDVGKTAFGPSTPQDHINALIVEHAQKGAQVVRLKSGDSTIFGRLDEEIDACDAADVPWHIVPGITAASAAVASIGQSLTRRGRNASVRILTGHDMQGFADQDWRSLAAPDQVAAIYMGKKAARFIQGRLVMHGANPDTPITLIENASRADQRIVSTTLSSFAADLADAKFDGPALMFFGLAPRSLKAASADLSSHPKQEHA